MKTVISILSDQLIPNILFIKQLNLEHDEHIFVTTAQMEEKNKSSILASALGISEENYQKIVIEPNNPGKIISELLTHQWDKEAEYIVNITGGTKMMSQMVYYLFKELSGAQIYYWPIEYNYIEKLHPDFSQVKFEKNIELDLETYFAAYGFSFAAVNQLSYSSNRAEDLYKQVVNKGSAGLVTEISRSKRIDYLKTDKFYLGGGWFEEWLYFNLKKELKLPDSQIAFNLKLKSHFSKRHSESDNEIDVAFVYKNTLYLFECKVYNKAQINSKKITDAIYKLSSLRQSLGLKATAIVCVLSPFGQDYGRKETIRYLSEMARVKKVFSLETMENKTNFIQGIKNIVNFS